MKISKRKESPSNQDFKNTSLRKKGNLRNYITDRNIITVKDQDKKDNFHKYLEPTQVSSPLKISKVLQIPSSKPNTHNN